MDLTPEVTSTLVDVAFEVGLSLNRITVKDTFFGGQAVLQAMQTLESLMELTIDNCGCCHVREVAVELARNRGLGSLCMPRNYLGNEGFAHIAAALATNFTLRTLDCSQNDIGDAGAVALAFSLVSNEGLHSIILSRNNIGTEGARAIAQILPQNMVLQSLDLTGNPISSEGCALLSEGWGLRPLKALLLPARAQS